MQVDGIKKQQAVCKSEIIYQLNVVQTADLLQDSSFTKILQLHHPLNTIDGNVQRVSYSQAIIEAE